MNHKIHQRLVLTVFLLTISLSVFGQNSTNSIFEYGIEVGAGYNQLFMQSDSPAMHNRTAFSVMPSVRMFIGLNPTLHFGLYTFAGYNEFRGRDSGDYPAGGVKFSSEVKVQALDFGLFGLFRVSDFRFGMGAKYNHHVSVSDRYDYFGSASANWDWRNYDVFFAKSSIDLGFKLQYALNNRLSIGSEAWLGLTDLHNEVASLQNYRFRQNHFRVLVGYRLW